MTSKTGVMPDHAEVSVCPPFFGLPEHRPRRAPLAMYPMCLVVPHPVSSEEGSWMATHELPVFFLPTFPVAPGVLQDQQ